MDLLGAGPRPCPGGSGERPGQGLPVRLVLAVLPQGILSSLCITLSVSLLAVLTVLPQGREGALAPPTALGLADVAQAADSNGGGARGAPGPQCGGHQVATSQGIWVIYQLSLLKIF